MDNKIFYFDLETTGVNNNENGIHQISAIIEVGGEVKEELNLFCKPFPNCVIVPEALAVGSVTLETVNAYPPESEAYKTIINTLNEYCDKFDRTDKFHLCGYNNSSFDNQFLRKLWDRCNDKYFGSYFWSDTIDVMVLASYALKDIRHTMKDFKLHSVAKAFGVTVDESKLHDANYDLELTREVYFNFKQFFNQ